MKSICFFSSYFSGNQIPYYVKYYLEELAIHFTEVVLLTNKKDLADSEYDFLSKKNIQVRLYDNEGMDFGMWYKALSEFDKIGYERIGLINDSCVLFKSLNPFFDWANSSSLDYMGMIETGKISLHIQSYFLVINKRAIPFVRDYFKVNGIKNTYKGIILNYEIGLSEHILKNGLNLGGYFNYSKRKDVNPSFILADELIKNGSPIIKKKIISHKYFLGDYLTWFRNGFNVDYRYYIDLIKKSNTNEPIIDFDNVVKEIDVKASMAYVTWYQIGLVVFRVLRKSFLLRFLFHAGIQLRRRLSKNEK